MFQLSPQRKPAASPLLELRTNPGVDRESKAGTLAFGAALAAYIVLIAQRYATMPLPQLLNWVADDGFYYLQIARHIAPAGVSTFDGVTRTNGYHPLWMLCCTLLASVFRDRFTLVHAALWLAFACHAATGLLLTRLLKPYMGEFWSKIGGAVWLFNPLALHMCLCLTESSLYLLCLTGALIALQEACGKPAQAAVDERGIGAPSAHSLIQLGIALGLSLLARTDAIFLAAGSLAFLAVWQFRSLPRTDRFRNAAQALAIPALVCAAMLLPWLAYSWASVHSLAQDSGVMKSLWQSTWQNEAHLSLASRLAFAWRFTLGDWLQQTFAVTFQLPFIAAELLIGASAALAIASAYLLRRETLFRPILAATALLAVVTISMGLAYGYGVSDHQVWHLAEPALAVWLILYGWIGALAAKWLDLKHKIAVGSAFLAATAILGTTGAREFAPHYPWQVDVYRSQPILENLVPPGERIGCFNAGIPAYFSNRTVINLDGLVNHDAIPYWKSHRFADYLAAARIRYIIDESASYNRAQSFSQQPITAQVIASGPLAGWNPPVRYMLRVALRGK